ncbi:hypothetical protein [Ureaplasma ceti]|uniref:Uncharacterized protein n=1 Tax=Ureaplasma ceti TaxID=3119530 RepID=A0ABP9U9G3_9BACT
MIIALTFILPTIVIFNSIMSGRIIKKFQPELNDYLSLTYGFFLFIAAVQAFFIPVITVHNSNPKFFLYYLLAIQIIFLVAYLINWRYSFMRIVWDWRSLLVIMCGALLVIGASLGLKQWNSHYSNGNIIEILKYYALGWKDNVFVINNLTSIYLMEATNRSFALLFHITDVVKVYQYVWMITFATIISVGIYGMYFSLKEHKFWLILTYLVACLIVAVCSLVLVSTPSNGGAWILFGTILLFQAHIDNAKRIKYELGILHVNYITLGIFALSPGSIYVLIVTNVCIAMLSYLDKRNNATDYNILILFTTVLSLSVYLFLYNFIIGIIFTIIALAIYAIYMFVRKLTFVTNVLRKIDNISNFTTKIVSYAIAAIILLVAVFLMTISKKFNFNSSPWVINYFLNKDLRKIDTWYWIINSFWWSLNIAIILYALTAQFLKKKILKYVENITLTPIILNNTMTVWNPVSSNLWMLVANSNALMVTNDFIVNLVPAGINFIYYLLNKGKLSKSLIIVTVLTVGVTTGLILFNTLA